MLTKLLCVCVCLCVVFFAPLLHVCAATNLGLDWLDWTCFFPWPGVVMLPCGLHCPLHHCPLGVRQASVNCPLPMAKLLQTLKCYGGWRHQWAVPWMRLQLPWPVWEQKTHSTLVRLTSMYPIHSEHLNPSLPNASSLYASFNFRCVFVCLSQWQ